MEEFYICESCHQRIPMLNKTIHDVRCGRLGNMSSTSTGNSFQNNSIYNAQVAAIGTSPSTSNSQSSRSQSLTSHIPFIDLTDSPENVNISRGHNFSDGWQCESCTFNNPNVESLFCDVCGTPRVPIIENNNRGTDVNFEDTYDSHRSTNRTSRTRDSSQSSNHDQCSTSSTSIRTWNCSSCTFINNSNVNNCSICRTTRPPLPSTREVLVPDLNRMDVDDDDDDEEEGNADDDWADDVFGSTQSSLVSSALLGAGVGAGLAFMRGGNLSEGIVGGAGLGLLGGAIHSGFAMQQQQQQQQQGLRRPPSSGRSSSSSSSSSSASRWGPRQRGGARGITPYGRSHPFFRSNGEDPHHLLAEMMQQQMQSMMLHRRGGAMDIDGLSYEQLLERFQAPPRGVDRATMASLPTHSYQRKASSSSSSSSSSSASPSAAPVEEKEESCSCLVCLEPFQDGEQLLSLPCCHSFHDPCIRRWLQGQHTCPVCKFSMPVEH